MSLPKYREYKDSGVEWLGRVPSHWNAPRLKTLLAETDQRAGGGEADLLGLSKSLGVVRRSELDQGAAVSDDYGKYKLVYPGQLVMNKMQAWNGVFGLSAHFGMVSPDYATFQFLRTDLGHYLTALFRTDAMAGVFFTRCRGMGTAFLRINTGDFLDIKVPLPPPAEVPTIAAFLDRETAKIDVLIAEQEKLIALLAEKRQATISHAVTKGLNPDTPMKSTGVAGLGEVSAHWKVAQLKRLCDRITDGAHISPETEGGAYSFVSTKDLVGDSIDFDKCLLTSPSSFDYLQRTGCRPAIGDVLFSKDGTIGRTVVVREGREFVVASSLIIITPSANLLDSDFLNYLCKSSVVSGQVEGFIKGAGLPRLSIQNLLKVVGLFPPMEEQRAISDYLKVETRKVDVLSAAAERAVALLKERRSALIAAAVTGQIDVRNAVVQHGATPEAIAA